MADLNVTQAGQDQNKLSSVGVSAVVSQCVLMTAISLGAVLAFNVLRPRNQVVYSARRFFVDEKGRIQAPADGFFSWLPTLWRTKEDEIVEKLGLDAAVFLRFLRLLRALMLVVSALSLGLLLPINVVYNLRYVPEGERNELSQLTVADVKARWLWAPIAAAYVFNIVTMILCWWNYREVLGRRMEFLVGDFFTNALHTRCLLVTHVPDDSQTDEALRALVDELELPHKPVRVSIGHEFGDLPDKIDDQHAAVKKLESALLKYLKHDRLAPKRPTVRPDPWWKLWTARVDAIDYWTERIQALEKDCYEQRKQFGRPESYGFVSFATAAQVQEVFAEVKRKKATHKGIKVVRAPNPRDIIWRNVGLSRGQLSAMRVAFQLLLALVVFWYTIPLALVSVVANLATMSEYLTFLKKWQRADQWSFSLVSGIISPLLAGIFAVLLPIALRALVKYQGAYSYSSLELVVLKRLYMLFIVSQLFIFSILSVVLQLIVNVVQSVENVDSGPIIDSLKELPDAVSSAYLAQSNFWLTWLPMRGFLAFYDLANLLKLVLVTTTYLFIQTPRAVRKRSEPPKFKYSQNYASLLLIAAIGLIYAPLAPLVAGFAAVALTISSATFKYQLLFVFCSGVDTGGEAWPIVIDCLILNLGLMNVALVLSQSPHPSRAPLVGNAADPSSPPAVALQNRQVGPSCVAAVPVLILGIFQSTVLRRYRRCFYEYPIAASDVEAPQPEPTDVALDDGAASPTRAAVFRQKLAHPFRKLSRPLDKVLASLDDAGDATDDGLDSRPSAIDPLDRRLRAIAPRQDLDRRFGHPTLDAPLWTTMVFKRHEALLPQVYQGRGVAQTSIEVSELGNRRRRIDKVDGVAIVPVEDADLEVAPGGGEEEVARGPDKTAQTTGAH